MPTSIADLITELRVDPWRATAGFSQEIEEAHQKLFVPSISTEQVQIILNKWLQKYQPCLFGRMVAAMRLINYCVLTESDIKQGDLFIKDKIQRDRLQWTREGFNGAKSGFIILLLSEKIAYALPDDTMLEIAKRVAALYLQTDVIADDILLEEVFLQKPGPQMTTWKWNAGVNYFCAQGDQRWWNDHRIPGGMGFSINSVGHLVKSAKMITQMKQLDEALGVQSEEWQASKVDSLDKALTHAMNTIANASDTVSGKATELLSIPQDRSQMTVEECPFHLATNLQDKNYCEYRGYYHTDYTIPSEYFRPDIERPSDIRPKTLDFTYLFWNVLENPAFTTMGVGQQIRDEQSGQEPEIEPKLSERLDKNLRVLEEEIPVDQCLRLKLALID